MRHIKEIKMKLEKTANGHVLKMSKSEWTEYGRQAGWLKEAQVDRQEVWLVHTAMRKWGGNFVQKLGECLAAADPSNAEKIRDAFPEYWDKYLEIGRSKQEDML
jgi:hypothetical protein